MAAFAALVQVMLILSGDFGRVLNAPFKYRVFDLLGKRKGHDNIGHCFGKKTNALRPVQPVIVHQELSQHTTAPCCLYGARE